jgi:hypothetical protein
MKCLLFIAVLLIVGSKANQLVGEETFPHDSIEILESAQTDEDVPAPVKINRSLRLAMKNQSTPSKTSKWNEKQSLRSMSTISSNNHQHHLGKESPARSLSRLLISTVAKKQARYSNDAANTRTHSPTWRDTEDRPTRTPENLEATTRVCPTSESSSWQALAESSPILKMCYVNEDCADYLPEEGPACCSHPFCICTTIYPGYQRDFDCVNA